MSSQATNSLLYSIVVVNVNVAQKLTDQLKPSYLFLIVIFFPKIKSHQKLF